MPQVSVWEVGRMAVAVLGGGLQGTCLALALAERGTKVVLIEGRTRLMDGAASANEGKIHLGYMYANDPTLATARMMMRGALSFEQFLSRHLASPAQNFLLSRPAIYSTHRESQVPRDEVASYLAKVHALIGEMLDEDKELSYFGQDLRSPLRQWNATQRGQMFDPRNIVDAFSTPEVAISPEALAERMRIRVGEESLVEVRLGHKVTAVRALEDGVKVECLDGQTPVRETFDQVVNCLWDGRIEIDRTFGQLPIHPWLYRLKYGVRVVTEQVNSVPSTTIVSGPFGEVVNYGNGLLFLTWYPTCVRALASDIRPPDWPLQPATNVQQEIASTTAAALAAAVPALSSISNDEMNKAIVKGGTIVAWGNSDIYDQKSQLHQRYEIGVSSHGRYHSIDPGKLTLAPYFAKLCCDRVCGANGRL